MYIYQTRNRTRVRGDPLYNHCESCIFNFAIHMRIDQFHRHFDFLIDRYCADQINHDAACAFRSGSDTFV